MRIGIISDTHDKRKRTAKAVALLVDRGVEAIFHCGDLTEPEIVEYFGGIPTYFVFGNNDFQIAEIRRKIREIDGECLEFGGEVTIGSRRIAMTHGDSGAELRRLADAKPDYLLFGHSHVMYDERRDATRWINPGAIHRASTYTAATLELATDLLEYHEIE